MRPIEPADLDAIGEFFARHGRPDAVPAQGLLGKVVGELVTVVTFALQGEELRIEELVVADDLRRKRIGRYMLGQTEELGATLQARRLVIESADSDSAGFLRRVGFDQEGVRWVRSIVR